MRCTLRFKNEDEHEFNCEDGLEMAVVKISVKCKLHKTEAEIHSIKYPSLRFGTFIALVLFQASRWISMFQVELATLT